MKKLALSGAVGFCALAMLLGACAESGSNPTGAAGTSGGAGTGAAGTGAAGTNTAGAAGTGAAGTGAAGTGAAGTGAAGTGAAGTGAAGTGAAGTGAAGTGAAGTGAAGTGAAGTGAAGTGAAGTGAAGTGAAGTGAVAKMSEGCGMPPANNDSATAFVKHDIMVTGVSTAYVAAHPLAPTNGAYTFTARNYYLRLPPTYNPDKPYRLAFGGTGCGGGPTVGSEGGYLASSHADQIQVSLSYVPTQGATGPNNPGSCFADGSDQSPEVPYFDAVLAEVSKKYCIDPSKVSMQGYSSGAWLAYLYGWARAGVVRGIAAEAGGLRNSRPPGSMKPVAAFLVATLSDTENPVNLTPTDAKAISLNALGSGQARDEILARNKCMGTATAVWDAQYPLCQKYTGCPAAYPVVWCGMTTGGHYPAHPPYTPDAMNKFLSTLPELP